MSIDEVLDKLIRDVESSVHALYRGQVRQNTQRVKTDSLRNAARQALLPFLAPDGAGPDVSQAPAPTGAALTPDEIVAATRCVMAWLPMGAPNAANPQSRCVPAAREMTPTWGEREKARLALKRAAG